MLSLDEFFSIVVVMELVCGIVYFDSLVLSERFTLILKYFLSLLFCIEHEIYRVLEELTKQQFGMYFLRIFKIFYINYQHYWCCSINIFLQNYFDLISLSTRSVKRTIEFTYEMETNNTSPFLNIMLYCSDNSLKLSVHYNMY